MLARELEQIVPRERVKARPIDVVAFASDASFYRLVPKAVVLAAQVEEIRGLFAFCRARRLPMTFRAAGTSLSGQAVTDGLLVEVMRNWRGFEVLDGGKLIRVQPGVLGAQANLALRPFGAKIGPDPASIASCTLGGILANNSSGKCCGVEHNAYHTLESIAFVLPSGTAIDTAGPDADARFRALEPALAEGLLELKREIESSPELAGRIRAKYRMKNTTGYSLNAFLDYERPVDIFAHLLVGSEGTLAFIAEAVLRTIPDLPFKYTGWLFFESVHAACAAIAPLRDAGARALELADRAALAAVQNQPGVPEVIARLPPGAAGLLAEFQAASREELAGYEEAAERAVSSLRLLADVDFSSKADRVAQLWRVREGMYPSVGAMRQSGTTVIIEDVAFPLEHLADAAVELSRLFETHGYDDAIIFGHARDGNLHFVISQSFNDPASIEQYGRFMDAVVELVVSRYDGALKAEHGTGRNMAPFVEAEWGPEALAVMRKLKALADPDGILNPGVILNSDSRAHLANLKSLPSVEQEVDTCVECGFCERVCPSRDLTLTPRQRIVVRREMVRQLGTGGETELYGALWRDYLYEGMDTCAADGMCATACPVRINTGTLVKRFRHERRTRLAEAVGRAVAGRFALAETLVRASLRAGHALGPRVMGRLTRLAHRVAGPVGPIWLPEMPAVASPLPETAREGAAAVYLPACITRAFGAIPGERSKRSLPEAMVELARRAGVPVWIPEDVAGTCCGTPFWSKGLVGGLRVAANRALERCWAWSDEGRLPVVIDASSCALGLRECGDVLTPENRRRLEAMRVLDSVAFLRVELLPRLEVRRRAGRVAVHPTCSAIEMGLAGDLVAVAAACSEEVVVPQDAGCCAFAGDRGFLFPELTASATRPEAENLHGLDCDDYVSSNRTCEVGMTRATGRVYRSVAHLLEEATRLGPVGKGPFECAGTPAETRRTGDH